MGAGYRELRVWQLAMKLVVDVYHAADSFPRQQQFGLTSQVQRSAVSIPSNIAEGKGRQTDRDYLAFLFRARGSLLELETQLIVARELNYLSLGLTSDLLQRCGEIGRGLQALINSLERSIDNEAKLKSAAKNKG
jgi:four helix bundle protein